MLNPAHPSFMKTYCHSNEKNQETSLRCKMGVVENAGNAIEVISVNEAILEIKIKTSLSLYSIT